MPKATKTKTPMTPLKHTLMNDVLFKMVFCDYPELLKRLVALVLRIPLESIKEFRVKNSEIPPDIKDNKFCRLDIVMSVDGRIVDLEIQVENDDDYPERSLYNWARLYSRSLRRGRKYRELPRTIVINIVAFKMFEEDKTDKYLYEFLPLESTLHFPLTDKMAMYYIDLTKLPKLVDGSDELQLWLALFKAKTEEELTNLITIGGPIMAQAVSAYRRVSKSEKFEEIDRLLSLAALREGSALKRARREEREKWESVVAEKDTALAAHVAALAEQAAAYTAALAELEALRAQLGK